MAEILKKITVKDVIASADKTKYGETYGLTAGKKTAHALFLILGRITKVEAKATEKGDYILFSGMFEAVRTCDGERFKASRLILPAVAQDAIEQAWIENLPRDENGAPDPSRAMALAFAFNIGIRPHEAAVGYQYTVTPVDIGDDAETDPLAAIRTAAEAGIKALAAPEPVKAGKQEKDS